MTEVLEVHDAAGASTLIEGSRPLLEAPGAPAREVAVG